MAYSRGRNYRTKGRKSRKRRMKKGRRGKKRGGTRLKTQVSSLRRQVKNLIKSPAIAGKPLKNHRGVIVRPADFPLDVQSGNGPYVAGNLVASDGKYQFTKGSILGRSFPEFKVLPFVTSGDDIFPHVTKSDTIVLKSLNLTFDLIWPANLVDPRIYQTGFVVNKLPTSTSSGEYYSPKCNPDVEVLLLRYTSATGLTKALGTVTSAAHEFNDQEYEDQFYQTGNTAVVAFNQTRDVYAGVTQGHNPHKAQGFEDVHIVDRKLIKFPQTKFGDMMPITNPENKTGSRQDPLFLNPEVRRSVSLGVNYAKGKKIELSPVPYPDIVRGATAHTETSHIASYWTTVCANNGFAVVCRYAGQRLGSEIAGNDIDPSVLRLYTLDTSASNPAEDYVNEPADLGDIGAVLSTVQWQNCKFSCKYYDA
jgi:hypothetical protein